MTIQIGQTVSWVDACEGPLSGRVEEVWSEQDIAVVACSDEMFDSTFFVPFAKLETTTEDSPSPRRGPAHPRHTNRGEV